VGSAIVLELTIGLGAAAVRASAMDPGQFHSEGAVPGIAFAVVCAAPGALALLAVLRGRPLLLAAAGLACFPIAVVSIVLIPLLIPGVMMLVEFGRWRLESVPPARIVVTLGSFVAAELGAGALLIVGMASYTYSFAGGGSSGSYVPTAHAAAALFVVAIGSGVALLSDSLSDRG
jgi:hypothetical protein